MVQALLLRILVILILMIITAVVGVKHNKKLKPWGDLWGIAYIIGTVLTILSIPWLIFFFMNTAGY